MTNIPNLLVYIIRTNARRYYAGFVNVPEMPNEWPVGIGLERLFTGERKGVHFLDQCTVEFTNNAAAPFSILTAAGAIDPDALPADIAVQAVDAIEFIEEEITVPAERTFG